MAPAALNGDPLPDTPISTVLVIVALQAEIAPLVERLKLAEDAVPIFPAGVPWKKFSGVYKKINVHAITPGKDEIYDVDHVGTVPASLITFAAVQAVKPDLIINAGTAGGFKVTSYIPNSRVVEEAEYEWALDSVMAQAMIYEAAMDSGPPAMRKMIVTVVIP